MRIHGVGVLVLLIVAAVVACGGQPESQLQQAPAAQEKADLAAHMKEHFTRVTEVRDAVIMNDEKAAQEAANWIVEHEPARGLPQGWPPHVENMRSAAREALHAGSVDEAGLAVGRMARVCGECHQAMNAGLETPEAGSAPMVSDQTKEHMQRHQWAIEQMWTGLVYPSEDAWRRGADALAFAALKPEEMGRPDAKEVSELADRVHTLGARGAATPGWDDRAQVYGTLLGTCIRCHQVTKG